MGTRIRSYSADAGTLTFFVTDCASCGVIFGITDTLEARRREDHGNFYCPNGHVMVFKGPTEAEKRAAEAQERAARMRTLLIAQQDQTAAAKREAAEAKASEVRLRWRVGNGVCPCCQRTFPALASHVATKHPEFVHVEKLSARMQELLVSIRQATEREDAAVLETWDIPGLHHRTLRALEARGLVNRVDYAHVALTESGWPVAEQIAAAGRDA